MRSFFYYWCPVVVISFIIYLFSSLPEVPQLKIKIPFLDKFQHVCIYALLGYFAKRAFAGGTSNIFLNRFAGLCAFLFCVYYGAFDEIYQSYIPSRECSVLDLLADAMGGFLGQYFYYFVRGFKSFPFLD